LIPFQERLSSPLKSVRLHPPIALVIGIGEGPVAGWGQSLTGGGLPRPSQCGTLIGRYLPASIQRSGCHPSVSRHEQFNGSSLAFERCELWLRAG
jgi:hypothetical protein